MMSLGSWLGLRLTSVRDPVALVMLGVVLGLSIVLVVQALSRPRRRWDDDYEKEDEKPEITDNHKALIEKRCRAGNSYDGMLKDFGNWLPKYDRADVERICSQARADNASSIGKSGDCGRRSPCPNRTLAQTHPCLNNDKTKCCKMNNDGSIDECLVVGDSFAQSQNIVDTSRTKACKRAYGSSATYSSKPGKNGCYRGDVFLGSWLRQDDDTDDTPKIKDWNMDPKGECDYTSTVARNGNWVCPSTLPVNTGLGHVGRGWGTGRQCTSSISCKVKIRRQAQKLGHIEHV